MALETHNGNRIADTMERWSDRSNGNIVVCDNESMGLSRLWIHMIAEAKGMWECQGNGSTGLPRQWEHKIAEAVGTWG